MSVISIVGYLALFVGLGFAFLFGNLLVGRFLRPDAPNEEKLEVYECGEPTIGSSFVQFDLRFYVVALLFLIFDVEVALFFPWATVFGKATHLANARLHEPAAQVDAIQGLYRELGVPAAQAALVEPGEAVRSAAWRLAAFSLIDILVFFAVLMVGFFYVWKRGDLDWVRTISRARAQPAPRGPAERAEIEPVLVA